ncbi:MAG: hypothetical protein U0Q15_01365 [Kineosporiaceae bacterium]
MGRGGLVGADTAALAELGSRLEQSAAGLRDVAARLRAALHAAPWVGDGADRYRSDWDTTHSPALSAAADLMATAASTLHQEGGEQDEAGADRGGSFAGRLPGRGGTTATWVTPDNTAAGGGGGGGETPGTPGGPKFALGDPTKPPFEVEDYFPYDPKAKASLDDRMSWLKWQAMLNGAEAVRPDLDDGLAAYRHYMEGSGTPLTVDYEEAYREDPMIRKGVDVEVASAAAWADEVARSGKTSFRFSGDGTGIGHLSGYPETENWQKAIGDHQVWSSADVTVDGDQVTMKIKVHAEDRFDFNKDAKDIRTGEPDNANGRFATLGWAKPFDTHGELERTVTWKLGDPPPDLSGTSGDVARNPGREDRVDGFGSSGGLRPAVPDNDRSTGSFRAH